MNKYLEKIANMSMKDVDTIHRGYDNPGWQALNYGTPLAVAGGAVGVAHTVGKFGRAMAKDTISGARHGGHVDQYAKKLLGSDLDELIDNDKIPEVAKRAAKAIGKKIILPGAIGAAAGTAYGIHSALSQNKKMDEAMESHDPTTRRLARESAVSSKKNVLGHTLGGIPNPLPGSTLMSGIGAHLTNKRIEKQLEKTRD